MPYCSQCGFQVEVEHQFCSECGEKLPGQQSASPTLEETMEQIDRDVDKAVEELGDQRERLLQDILDEHENLTQLAQQDSDQHEQECSLIAAAITMMLLEGLESVPADKLISFLDEVAASSVDEAAEFAGPDHPAMIRVRALYQRTVEWANLRQKEQSDAMGNAMLSIMEHIKDDTERKS